MPTGRNAPWSSSKALFLFLEKHLRKLVQVVPPNRETVRAAGNDVPDMLDLHILQRDVEALVALIKRVGVAAGDVPMTPSLSSFFNMRAFTSRSY
jgi:hypothetical protein